MKKIGFLVALSFVLVFSSCKMVGNLQVEKRHYGKGYYVHVRDKNTDIATTDYSSSESVLNNVGNSSTVVDQSKIVEEKKSSPDVRVSKTFNETRETTKIAKQNLSLTKNEMAVYAENKNVRFVLPKKGNSSSPAGDVSQLVLIILALIISPLAIFLKEGVTTRFWIDLICWLLGAGIVGFYYYGGGLLLFAIVFAVLIVIDAI